MEICILFHEVLYTVKSQIGSAADIIHFKSAPIYSPKLSADWEGVGFANRGGVCSQKIVNHIGVLFLYPLIHL